jgi:Flp pilus assembly protein TadD
MCIESNPKFAYAHNNRGFCKFKQGNVKEGLRGVNLSLKLDPSNAYAYKFRGVIYQAQGKLNLAREDFLKALELGYTQKYDDEVGRLLGAMDQN